MTDLDVAAEFARLRGAIDNALPGPTAPFNPPATGAELDRLATVLGRPVPGELAALLRVANGQDDPMKLDGPINFHRFLSAAEIAEFWRVLNDAVGDLSEPQPQPSHYSRVCWSPAWIPFMANEGDSYVLDLDPGELGTVGQVVFRPNVPDLDGPKAPSLAAFLHRVIAIVEAGEYSIRGRAGHHTIVSLEMF